MLTACSTGPYVPQGEGGNAEAAGYPVVYLDEDLRRTLAMDIPPTATHGANGALTVHVAFRNRSDAEVLQFQVQTLFRDANGLVLYSQPGSEAPWQSLSLTPGQSTSYTQAALNAKATAFTVRVRYAGPGQDLR
jgi:hypothetical protein